MYGIQKQSVLSMNDLPLEILITILEESEWRDVLQLRKVRFKTFTWHVSKIFTPPDLHGVLRSLEDSEHLVEFLSRLPCSIYYISPAFALRTTSLEVQLSRIGVLLALTGAEIGWTGDNSLPARSLAVTTTNRAVRMHLVEGGRWLLVVSKTGSVNYLDLDSPTISEAILISDQIDDPTPTVWRDIEMRMAIDMDRASPFLVFNIAFSSCSLEDTRGPREHKIQVWHVDLVFDERRHGVGLTCNKHMATFPLERGFFCPLVARASRRFLGPLYRL